MPHRKPRKTGTAAPGRLRDVLFWVVAISAALFARQILDAVAWMQARLEGAPGTDPDVAARLEAGIHMVVSVGVAVVILIVLGAAFRWAARRDAARRQQSQSTG